MPEKLESIEYQVSERKEEFRIKLLSYFLLIGLFSAAFQFLIDLVDDSTISIYNETILGAILAIFFIINKKGYYKISRTGTLISINVALFFLYRITPNAGLQYYYFPLVLTSFILYDQKDWAKTLLFAFLPLALFTANTIEHLNTAAYLKEKETLSIILNFATASVLSSIAIVYLIRSYLANEGALIRANKEISQVSNNLEINNQILAKTNDELDKFMYSSSHDLRAPLASILGLVNLAQLEPPEKHKMYLDMIRDRVVGMDYFIKEIIDFSKNSKTELKYELLDVQDLINLCVERNRYLPNTDKIELTTSIDTKNVKSDSYRLSSILTALIANAIQYHNFDQENPMLWITVKGGNPVEFEIKDNGLGFNPTVKSKMFDMFYRGSERSKGAGLGLYIAKEMLHSLRGSFEVNSEEGKGSSFSFYIPVPN